MDIALFAQNFGFRKSCFKYGIGFLLIMSLFSCSAFKKTTVYESDDVRISDQGGNIGDKEAEITVYQPEDIVMFETSFPENDDKAFEEKEEFPEDCKDEQLPSLSVPNKGKTGDDAAFYAEYSKKLGIRLDGRENKGLIRAAANWLGAPYKWGGCLKSGVDCSCLVKLIYKEAYGISLNRNSVTIVQNDISPVTKTQLKEGDIISFKMNEDNRISHIGIYLKNNKFIHVSRQKGVMISDLGKRYYRLRFFSAGRSPVKAKEKPYMASSSGTKGHIKLNKLAVSDSAPPQTRETGTPGNRLLAKLSELSVKTAGMP